MRCYRGRNIIYITLKHRIRLYYAMKNFVFPPFCRGNFPWRSSAEGGVGATLVPLADWRVRFELIGSTADSGRKQNSNGSTFGNYCVPTRNLAPTSSDQAAEGRLGEMGLGYAVSSP